MEIGVGLNVSRSAEAVPFYMRAFGLTLGYHVKNEDGSYYHSELCDGEKTVFCVVEGRGAQDCPVQLGIEFGSPDEVRRVFRLFCEDGARVDMPVRELPWSPCAASVIDRFGIWWYFSALSHRPADAFDPKNSVE